MFRVQRVVWSSICLANPVITVIRTNRHCFTDIPALSAQQPAGEISQTILQSLPVKPDDEVVRVVGVVLKLAVVREIKAHDIGAEAIECEERVYDISFRFRHLLVSQRPVAVSYDA